MWTWLSEDTQVSQAMDTVKSWGYPRSLTPEERTALWLYRPGIYVWLELLWSDGRLHGVIHIAKEPGARVFGRPVVRAMKQLQTILGLSGLWALESEDCNLAQPVVDYLLRLGFEKAGPGYVRT